MSLILSLSVGSVFVLLRVDEIYSLSPRESLRKNFKEINIPTLATQYIYETEEC